MYVSGYLKDDANPLTLSITWGGKTTTTTRTIKNRTNKETSI